MNDTIAKPQRNDLVRHTSNIVSAYLSKNSLGNTQIQDVITAVYTALTTVDGAPADAVGQVNRPSVSIKKSIMPDYIVCLEDGKKLKMLKRHLRTSYNMTPDDYRAKWGLPSDYPMVAPNYAVQRSDFAKKIGLGRKTETTTAKPAAPRKPRK